MKIEVKNLRKSFGELVLFEDYSFELESNEITCLYGKSGSGKTTLLNILGGIEDYQQGEILYNGKKLTPSLKRKFLSNDFGFVFQNFGLLENETVYSNFMLIKKVKKMRKFDRDKLIHSSLDLVGLAGCEKIKVYTLSGGEQQRVAVAKMLAKDCNIIFADEPTASLDWENKEIILKLFRLLKMRGKTIIIVSHDDDVKNAADKVIEIKRGESSSET